MAGGGGARHAGPVPTARAAESLAPAAPAAGPVLFVRTAAGVVVCERCRPAHTVRTRMRGLLGRDALAPGEGLWIRPTASIHTLFMRFAIDVLFLDRDDVVVRIVEVLGPWRLTSCRRARSAIELGAGEIARRGLRVGDRLVAEAAAPGNTTRG